MKKINRLGRGKDMTALMRYGRRISSPLFQVIARSTALPHPRFVFVVGRAADKRAVMRNRLRRRAAEYIRTHLADIPSSCDLAVIIKKEASAARRDDFYEILKQTLARVR